MTNQQKRLLIVNDDGIEAPGLKALVRRLVKDTRFALRVVAPATEQSAKSGAMTVHGTLDAQRHVFEESDLRDVWAWKVFGTPVDCIKLGLCEILKYDGGFNVDLVLSGINRGNNAGLNPLASGTVGAALSAKSHGLNAVALSLDHPSSYVSGEKHAYDRWNYDLAAELIMPVIEDILHHHPLNGIVLNVNIPNLGEKAEFKGIRRTRQGWSSWNDYFKEPNPMNGSSDVNPRRTYSIHGDVNLVDQSLDYDTFAIRHGYVAVTPLGIHFDPSHFEDYRIAHDQLKEWSIFKS